MSDLHNEIMNLQIGGKGTSIAREALTDSGGVHIAYKIGHRDARHAAAELAAAYENHHAELVEALREVAEFMEFELEGQAWDECKHMAHFIRRTLAKLDQPQ